jgi:hypothetical protein
MVRKIFRQHPPFSLLARGRQVVWALLPAGRTCLTVLALSAFFLLIGCQEATIEHYRVPKDRQAARRLLAAIIPHGDRIWFFKLSGPLAEVDKHEKEFEQFIQSVRFTDKPGRPITWTAPKGWREEPGAEMRFATFKLGPKGSPLELVVTPLGEDASSLLDNVNRWRDQIGLPKVGEQELDRLVREITVDGKPAALIDLKPDDASEDEDTPDALQPPTYTLPKGWEKSGKQVPFSIATFEVRDGEQKAEVTISPLAGPAGGLLSNVKRWRDKLGLKPVDIDEMKQDLRPTKVAGIAGHTVDLSDPDRPAAERQRILAVIVPHRGQTWFFKLSGPADLVEKQKSAFEAFLESMRFDGGSGAKP